MASRVIIIDPWWNSAAEQQAFCRVYRFGQADQTYLTRFCVRRTVDERLIKMQERKQKEIDSVMENDGSFTSGWVTFARCEIGTLKADGHAVSRQRIF